MTSLECYQFPYGTDNYGVLVHDETTGDTACIDAGDAAAALDALAAKGWTLSHLLITHHHADHTAGLINVKETTGCQVIGPVERSKPINGIDQHVDQSDTFDFAGRTVRVIHTPGHTTDMVNFYFEDDQLVFTGDTLFSMGCGRLFEGDAAMMLESINKLVALPDSTQVYCAHEYTLSNAKFAVTVDGDNPDLLAAIEDAQTKRAAGLPTVPTTVAVEKRANPFFTAGSAAELGRRRALKDKF